MGADDGDFNPSFSFDMGGFSAQPAWEFTGALKQAKSDLPNGNFKATTIDDKIQGRLNAKAEAKNQKKQNKRQAKKQDDSDDDEDEDDEDDEDAPLPGELDDDDDDDDDSDIVDDDDDDSEGAELDDEEEEEEEEEEEQEPPAKPAAANKGKQPEQPASKKAPASKADTSGKAGKAEANGKSHQQQKQQKQVHVQPDEEEEEEVEQGHEEAAQQGNGKPQGGSGGFYAHTPEGTTFKASSFGDLNLSRPLVKACTVLGYTTPTPIQAAVIPLALAGRDICGSAVTGSGKTAAFALPCLERLLHRSKQIAATYVLILTPTRELAVQIHSMITKLGQFTDISVALVVGGLSLQVQASVLRRSPEIVVATPGRLIDHLRNTQSVGLEDLAVLVLDEADRLLEMGFKDEIAEIVKSAPRKRQTMLFSATFNDEVRRLMALSLKQPVRLAADAAAAVPRDLKQEVVRLKGAAAAEKEACLLALCARTFHKGHAIIFFKTKQRAHRVKILFGLLGLPPAAELHGDMTQAARLESLEAFRTGKAAFLLATDVAARGLDIQGVETVLNYDAPVKLESYLHRIGRTARAGAAGVAVTFIEDGDRALLKEVVKKTKANIAQRVVPQAAVSSWQAKAEAAQGDVYKVIAEEREERELRKAEMEAVKMQNMIDHEDDIKSRPQRTWFLSERQKRDVARKAANEAAGQDDPEEEEDDGRSKAKAKQDAKNKKREKRKLEAAEEAQKGGKKRRDILQEETGDFTRAIKSSKSKMRALKEQGLSSAKAARIIASQAVGPKNKSSKKRKEGGSKLFAGDGTGRAAAGGSDAGEAAGKAAGGDAKYKRDRSNLSKVDLNRVKRGGVGKKQFKSKKKYRRK